MRNLVYGLGETSLSCPFVGVLQRYYLLTLNVAPGAVGGGLAVFGAVLEVLNSKERKPGLSKECSSRKATPFWLRNLRE